MIFARSLGRRYPRAMAAAVSPQTEKKEEKKEKSQSNAKESAETVALRRASGVFHGADTKEQKAESASSRRLVGRFNERVRDAILGRSHHRLSENAVSAPKRDPMPSEQSKGLMRCSLNIQILSRQLMTHGWQGLMRPFRG